MKQIKEMNLQELADEMNVYSNIFPHIGLVVDRIHKLHEIAERQNQMNKFLSGESDLNGYWFGEVPPNEKPYWWRKHLENLGLGANSSIASPSDDMPNCRIGIP